MPYIQCCENRSKARYWTLFICFHGNFTLEALFEIAYYPPSFEIDDNSARFPSILCHLAANNFHDFRRIYWSWEDLTFCLKMLPIKLRTFFGKAFCFKMSSEKKIIISIGYRQKNASFSKFLKLEFCWSGGSSSALSSHVYFRYARKFSIVRNRETRLLLWSI